ncbi:Uncharacterized protein M6B38_227640 [Iris pallida]|uniref:Fungal lipase-type domain-containing protein n=1 Tax=Iris pallida TaxID=29817 RepID=A0AAX6DTV6_IRIPA|nr:Uncharacterized protein M6B38_227640 [Iris pallida]
MAITSVAISPAKDIIAGSIRRPDSGNDLRCDLGGRMRRSRSEPVLRCSMSSRNVPKSTAAKIKTSRSIGLFPFNSILPSSLKSFFADEESTAAMRLVEDREENEEGTRKEAFDEGLGSENERRSNWVERLLELRTRWRDRQKNDDVDEEEEEEENVDYYCGVNYDSEEEQEEEFDREKFSKFLSVVPWSETKLFSQLAFLCNMAYVIPEIKAEDLRKYYDLRLVTSSLEKKSEAAMKAMIESDSTRPPSPPNGASGHEAQQSKKQRPIRPSVAYEIAASAASYVQSRAKGLLSLAGTRTEEDEEKTCVGERPYNPEMAAFVAASTMTAVVAAEEEARLEAAKDLQSLHSSPCEWFVCDDPSTCTRCFVIQGSDSLASWQANLFFEPTKFEGMEVLVHRGIYEAAKGIYEQFMPEILAHVRAYGDRANFRFTGHSLGGSLSLLVNLMLVARGVLPASALLPVVTFGSPSVFCGGKRVLDELGLDDGHIRSVMMHRDIVPRAFSCNYPNHVAQVLKRLNGAFRSHPCLNNEKLLYSPLGKLFILQPDDKTSPPHPLLPTGAALYALQGKEGTGASKSGSAGALRAFINLPHPLETLSDPTAYGSDGTILRDHDSSNYLKAVNGLLRQHTKSFVRKSRRQRLNHWWPLLTSARTSEGSWTGHRESSLEQSGLVAKEVVTGV